MTQVLVRWDDADWSLDTEEIELTQAFVIKDQTKDDQFPAGRNLGAWELGIKSCEPGCVRALYWVMLQQAGLRTAITSVPGTFQILKFHRAWAEATAAEMDDPEALEAAVAAAERQAGILRGALERARAKHAPEPEAGPTPRPGTDSARSGTPGSSTTRKHSAAQPAASVPAS